jgi:hypothetical protein
MADYNTLSTPTRSSSRPASTRSAHSNGSREASSRTSEHTPLLARPDDENEDEEETPQDRSQSRDSSLYQAIQPKVGIFKRRWPSFVALMLLFVFTIAIMLLGFFVPEVMEEYAMQAKKFELTSVSLPEFTAKGAKARIQGVFWMDPAEVKKKSVRDIGVFGTWVAGAVRSGESTVRVTLPEYGDVLLGTAVIPSLKVDIRAKRKTHVNFLADLEPGDITGIRKVADDWVSGRLGELKVLGEASVKLRSGILSLGTQTLSQSLLFAGDDIPAIPAFNITKLLVHETALPDGTKTMEADVSLWVKNDYPLDFAVPPLGFGISVDNCLPDQPRILVADAQTPQIPIRPRVDLNVNVSGTVRHLPDELTNACPESGKSPLDAFLGDYIKGQDITIYVRGSDTPSADTPQWLSELISSITVPVPFQGHTFENLIRNFSLADVHFSLPDPFAEPDTPEAQPQISAQIEAYINLPGEMNFPIDVNRVRANALVYYKGRKLGSLDLHKWQHANSTRIPPRGIEGPALLVESAIKDAPLEITDQDVFSEVVQKMLFGGKSVKLAIKADVDVEMETVLGAMTVRQIPAEGVVPIQRGF